MKKPRGINQLAWLALLVITSLFFSHCIHTAKGKDEKSSLEKGEEIYNRYCLACHQADGSGVPGMYPPLFETDYVTGDKERLIEIVLFGMTGKITVHGQEYNSVMAPHGFLSDEEVAKVLTYTRNSFGNEASAVTKKEVKAVREIEK
jgi:mono/diheme cytochrome c family protein